MGRVNVSLGLLMLAFGVTVMAAGPAVTDVTVDQARAVVQERAGSLVILDVRTPGEFSQGHIAGATNVDVQASDFAERLQKLDRAKTYLVYCRTGSRSRKAVQAMERLGFSSIYHLTDGIVGWQQRKLPVSPGS